jgi:uncharacterized protein YecE (DUF72 family)
VTAYVGISGWRYAPWRGDFYPEGLSQARELEYAAQRFATIELNGSFYSLQRPESYARWRAAVPDGFVFAIKGSRYITHMLRLRGVDTALANFFASGLFALGDKLGPFLWQFPPNFPYDRERLDAFFAALPRTGAEAMRLARKHDARVTGRARLTTDPRQELRHAIEIRHPSFEQPEFIELLRRRQIALVVADTAGKWPLLEDVTADFVYVRLHGDVELYASGYSDRALAAWARKIRAWLGGADAPGARRASQRAAKRRARRDVYVYFDNDIKVHAPYDAKRLAGKLGSLAAPANADAVSAPSRAPPSSDAARRARPRA